MTKQVTKTTKIQGAIQRKNNITNNFYSDEWYTSEQTANLAIEKLNIEKNKTVLCPYDSDKSEFVKQLKKNK